MPKKNIEYNGITKSISDWAFTLGFSRQLLHNRLKKYSVEIALNPNKSSPGRGKTLDKFQDEFPLSKKDKEILYLSRIPKVDGLAEVIAESHKEITENLFSSDELDRLRKIKELKKSGTNTL